MVFCCSSPNKLRWGYYIVLRQQKSPSQRLSERNCVIFCLRDGSGGKNKVGCWPFSDLMGERAWGRWHHHEACKYHWGPSSLNCACWPGMEPFWLNIQRKRTSCARCRTEPGVVFIYRLYASPSGFNPHCNSPSRGPQHLWWMVLPSILVGKSVLLGLPHCLLWVSAFSGLLNQESKDLFLQLPKFGASHFSLQFLSF